MAADDRFKFPDDFLSKINTDAVDDGFIRELGKLTQERREELAQMLIERKARRAAQN